DYACRLEHATDAEVADALAAFLNHPPDCPHGKPIPDTEGNIPELAALPLTDLEIGQSARLAYIAYEETVLLTYLAQRGFFPGVDLTLDDIAPYQGPLMIKIEDRIEALGREIAGRIFVLPA
ncbi:MAG: metal-dependent transcriptional regulator, partial [Chloroflexi bacterium]